MSKAENTLTGIDPVAEAAREIVRCIALDNKSERDRHAKIATNPIHYESHEEALSCHKEALEVFISDTQAQSLERAMAQVILASSQVDLLLDMDRDTEAFQIKRQSQSISRLLFSVVSVLEKESGAKRDDLGADHYMYRSFDHREVVRQLLAGITQAEIVGDAAIHKPNKDES